jgi:ribosomal protein L7Ae-like RNA K-turn-binding protein
MKKVEAYIGMAARAGRMSVGAQAVEHAVRSGAARLVIVDSDSSPNSQKKYMDMCRHHRTPCVLMEAPGRAAGKPDRMCLAVHDAKLAKQIEILVQQEQIRG